MARCLAIVVGAGFGVLAGCGPAGDSANSKGGSLAGDAATLPPEAKVRAVASIPPHAYFVERIGGNHVRLDVMVQPGQSPHMYEATPAQMAALAGAHLYFATGMEFEQRLLERILGQSPSLRVVDLRKGVTLRRFGAGEQCAHGHELADADHAHEHVGAFDPHIWLSPRLAKLQARSVCEALSALQPARREEFVRNCAEFEAELEALDRELTVRFAPLKGGEFLVFHPTYGYFADDYGLRQLAIEMDGKEPTSADLRQIIDRARASGAKFILLEREYNPRSAEAVAREIGARVLTVDPLARDYPENLRKLAADIATAATPPRAPEGEQR